MCGLFCIWSEDIWSERQRCAYLADEGDWFVPHGMSIPNICFDHRTERFLRSLGIFFNKTQITDCKIASVQKLNKKLLHLPAEIAGEITIER